MVVFDAKTTHVERKEYINVNFHNLKSIDNVKFCSDIKESWDKINTNEFQHKISSFNELTRKIVLTHAPQKNKRVKLVPRAPWFDAEYKTSRQNRRIAEKKYKRTGVPQHKADVINLRKVTTNLAFTKKQQYFTEKIEQSNGNSKALFNCLNTRVNGKKETFFLAMIHHSS